MAKAQKEKNPDTNQHVKTMLPLIIFASIFALIAIALTAVIWGLTQLVGAGDNFWSNGIVMVNILLWIVSIVCWVYVLFNITKRNQKKISY